MITKDMTEDTQSRLLQVRERMYQAFDWYKLVGSYPSGDLPSEGIPSDGYLRGDYRRQEAFNLGKQTKRNADAGNLSLLIRGSIRSPSDLNDLKHFLPRMFELFSLGNRGMDFGRLFEILHKLKWREWHTDEVEAIEQFVDAHWDCIIQTYPWSITMSRFLEDVHWLIEDMADYLNSWVNSQEEAALRHLVDTVTEGIGMYEVFGTVRHQIIQWMLSDKVKEKLEKAYHQHEENELGLRILAALEELDMLGYR